MAILKILKVGHPLLAQKASPVEDINQEIVDLARDMVETMYQAPGVGLAAPQVNKGIRLITVDLSVGENKDELFVLINPEIVEESGKITAEEGCLSVPGIYEKLERPERVVVKGYDLKGRVITIEARDLLAGLAEAVGERLLELLEVELLQVDVIGDRRELLRLLVGLLDEGYFIFFEEVDLCRRIRDAGFRIALRPEARVTHYGGRSRRQGRASVMAPRVRGLLRYLRKHEGAARSAAFEVAFRPLFAAGILADAASAGCKAAFYRARRGKERKAARMKEVFDAYCLFIRRDLFPFLLSLWE